MKRYQGDPYWLTLKYRDTCARCHCEMKPGEQGFRYKTGKIYCDSDTCGRQCEREFQSAAQDEAFMTGGY